MVPGTGTPPDSVTVTVRDELGALCRNAVEVEVDISDCNGLCVDSPDGLSGTADESGTAYLDPRVGGCDDCDVIVRANGIDIRSYARINSADWDGTWADGDVGPEDMYYISSQNGTSDPCADLNGDGVVDLADLDIGYLCLHASNTVTCPFYACEVTPATIDFGTISIGNPKDSVFTIRNTGGGILSGTVSESCDRYSIVSGGGWHDIPREDSLVVTVRFEPADTGVFYCTVQTGAEFCTDVFCTVYFIDTIPPSPPLEFSAAYNTGAGNQLLWRSSEAEDFDHYIVYRSDDPDLLLPEPVDTAWALVQSGADTSWTDNVPQGWRCRYQLTAVDHVGNESDPGSPTTVTGADTRGLPERFALYQNIPNPFNPVTTVRFDITKRTTARLCIFDVKGRLVRVLVDGPVDPGRKQVTWDGRNGKGNPVTSGVYFYHLVTPEFSDARKMILIR
jgi:hypothetical protein